MGLQSDYETVFSDCLYLAYSSVGISTLFLGPYIFIYIFYHRELKIRLTMDQTINDVDMEMYRLPW